jgi:hypothetical protein
MQGCTYYKYYLEIKKNIFKNQVHIYKILKKIIDESETSLKNIICTQNN